VEAEKMLEMSRKKPLICSIGFNYRFIKIVRIMKHLVKTGDLGDVIKIDIGIRRLFRNNTVWSTNFAKDLTSGALGDLGIHLIDLLSYLSDQKIMLESCLVKMKSSLPRLPDVRICADDDSVVFGRLTGGTYFSLSAARVLDLDRVEFFVEIIGTEKEFKYSSRNENVYQMKSGTKWRSYEFKRKMMQNAKDNFFDFLSSIKDQDSEWIKRMSENLDSSGTLAGFEDGVNAQTVLNALIKKCTE
jgi:glucose-6-phosphate 3-dehydrogenase